MLFSLCNRLASWQQLKPVREKQLVYVEYVEAVKSAEAVKSVEAFKNIKAVEYGKIAKEATSSSHNQQRVPLKLRRFR